MYSCGSKRQYKSFPNGYVSSLRDLGLLPDIFCYLYCVPNVTKCISCNWPHSCRSNIRCQGFLPVVKGSKGTNRAIRIFNRTRIIIWRGISAMSLRVRGCKSNYSDYATLFLTPHRVKDEKATSISRVGTIDDRLPANGPTLPSRNATGARPALAKHDWRGARQKNNSKHF